ncbi:MAG: dephospho-CoA kinase [Rhodocyclaceae bacterium]|nr:dephospho-CoA kinase [Rhodocyclaceae bacterium]MBX3667893.1 dephospho-CoA kinase [Rhodocyclaceae bacterium]
MHAPTSTAGAPGADASSQNGYLIGLTGGIGSGKSSVAAEFARLGAGLVDADAIARELTAPGGAAMPALQREFGPGVAAADGALDRAAMRALVFSDPAAKRRLEALLHPMIRAEGERRVARLVADGKPYVVIEVPLLVETGAWRERVARVLVVDCPPEIQVARVMARSGLSADEVRGILAHQASRAERLAAAADVIDNGGDFAQMQQQVHRLHARYLHFAAP